MRKTLISFFSLLLSAVCIFSLSGCSLFSPHFDTKTRSVLFVKTSHEEYSDTANTVTYSYYAVSPSQDTEPIESVRFTADEVKRCHAASCFASYIDHAENQVKNRLVKGKITDDHDETVPITPILSSILQKTAELGHDMITVDIIEDGDEYFVYTELNVNWWSPCCLYYYDQSQDSLRELYTFDNEELVSIEIRNLDLIRTMPDPTVQL